ncbi:MAG: helix-turn-helix domain-containing protein [Gammaproteobacteria bacterium]|nr:helix-turn-helix domain-containing protein [Gammaproteobacteria bacterium]
MTENSDETSSSSNSYSPTVGERLQVAREAKKITITEVVAQLRLTKETIVYLESDQWDKLHGRPYARGYFSNYVTFLGLPHDEMLALFNLEYTTTEPSIDGFKRTEPVKDDGVGLGWLKAVFVLALIGAVAWYAYQCWLGDATSNTSNRCTYYSIFIIA